MGSELVSFPLEPLPEGVRGGRTGVGAEDGLRGSGVDRGAMVSCAPFTSSESMVAAVFRSSAPPQEEQNRPDEETCAPQEEQYMGGEILPLEAACRERQRRPPTNSSIVI